MPPKIPASKSKKKVIRRRKVKKVPRFTSEELNEEIDAFLTTYNPYMSENCVEFDGKTRTLKPIFDYKKPVTVLKLQGCMKKKLPEAVEILFGEGESAEGEERMRNKFNFRSMASLTTRTFPSEHGNQIDSSLFPVLKFTGTVSKAEITQAYQNHEMKKKEKESDQYGWIQVALKKIGSYIGRKATALQDSSRKPLRLCERMVDQNLSEANLDYSYYDNPNDEFRPEFGSLLPLWSFSCVHTRRMPVTSIEWSAHFTDLFAVGYKHFREEEGDEDDLGKIQEVGYLCIYSLKGPNYPEKIIQCQSAVRCLTFHPAWSHLLAVGCEGGNLNVFDLKRERNDPAGSNKMTEEIMHLDTVNELRWLPDVLPQKFCSVSADGKILRWLFVLNDLLPYDVATLLKIKDWPGEVPPKGIETEIVSKLKEPPEIGLKMAGTCMTISPHSEDLFAVGTETGVIYKCSFDDKRHIQDYDDHKNTVSRVHWNPYHPRVLLSCSEDMTVRIWDLSQRESVFEFFFDYEVIDACWAPFSSTLFAAISGSAVLYVYDLAVNKKEAIGSYTVYTGKQNIDLTTICFHPSMPVLMIGDDRGHVLSFKLSPNLRSSYKALETLEKSKFITSEEEKMEKLLAPSKGRIKKK